MRDLADANRMDDGPSAALRERSCRRRTARRSPTSAARRPGAAGRDQPVAVVGLGGAALRPARQPAVAHAARGRLHRPAAVIRPTPTRSWLPGSASRTWSPAPRPAPTSSTTPRSAPASGRSRRWCAPGSRLRRVPRHLDVPDRVRRTEGQASGASRAVRGTPGLGAAEPERAERALPAAGAHRGLRRAARGRRLAQPGHACSVSVGAGAVSSVEPLSPTARPMIAEDPEQRSRRRRSRCRRSPARGRAPLWRASGAAR